MRAQEDDEYKKTEEREKIVVGIVNSLKNQTIPQNFFEKIFQAIIKKLTLSTTEGEMFVSLCIQDFVEAGTYLEPKSVVVHEAKSRYRKYLEEKVREVEEIAKSYISFHQGKNDLIDKEKIDKDKGNIDNFLAIFDVLGKEKYKDIDGGVIRSLIEYMENDIINILSRLETKMELEEVLTDGEVAEEKLKEVFKGEGLYKEAIADFKVFFENAENESADERAKIAMKQIDGMYDPDYSIADEKEIIDALLRMIDIIDDEGKKNKETGETKGSQ